MSIVLNSPMKTVAVYTPTISFSENAYLNESFAAIKGPNEVNIQTIQPIGGTDASSGEVTFSFNANNRTGSALNKCVLIEGVFTIRLTKTVPKRTGTSPAFVYSTVLTDANFNNRFALRSNPLTRAMQNLTATFDSNGRTLSINEWYPYMRYYNFTSDDLVCDSSTPNLPDNSAFFSNGTKSNPLAFFNEAQLDSVLPRGSFSVQSIYNPVNDTDADLPLTAVITIKVTEPINLSPLVQTQNFKAESNGFINISQFLIRMSFVTNLFEECCCLDTRLGTTTDIVFSPFASAPGSTTNPLIVPAITAPKFVQADPIIKDGPKSAFTSKTASLSSLKLIVQFNAIPNTMVVDPVVNYPWSDILPVYQTENLENSATVNANGVLTPGVNKLTLSSQQVPIIPTRVFFIVKPEGDIPVSGTADPLTKSERGDFLFPITNCNVLFGDTPSMLSTVPNQLLYTFAVKNGLGFTQYSHTGLGGYSIASYDNNSTSLEKGNVLGSVNLKMPIGYPLCLTFGTEQLYLTKSSLAPGVPQQYNFQAQITVLNHYPLPIKARIVTVLVYDGIMTTGASLSSPSFSSACLMQTDVLTASERGVLKYETNDFESYNYSGGASFFTKLGRFGKSAAKVVSSDIFRKGLDAALNVAQATGIPGVAQGAYVAEQALDLLNKRGSSMVAGGRIVDSNQMNGGRIISGGAQMTPQEIRKRLGR